MQAFSTLINYWRHLLWLYSIRGNQLLKGLFRVCLEGATMELSLSWCNLVENLGTAPSRVVSFLAFLTKHVSDIVSVVPVELVRVQVLAEFLLPESVSFFHG